MPVDLHSLFPWIVFVAVIVALLAYDMRGFYKHDHEISVRESLRLTTFYVAFALLFGVWVYLSRGALASQQYYVAYLVEKTLALDNIFVFSIIFQSFHIPKEFQRQVLFYGILGVIILRGLMLGFGIALVSEFEWILYIFGFFLILTGAKILFVEKKTEDITQNPLVRWLTNHLPMTHEIHGNAFFVRLPKVDSSGQKEGRMALYATPLLLCLLIIEGADVIFAIDSIPAVLAVSQDPYVVYTSNLFAILGLRALYFSWSAIMNRFAYLKYSLGLILVFIGIKIFVSELYMKVPSGLSLGVTVSLLAGGILVSLWKTRKPRHTDG